MKPLLAGVAAVAAVIVLGWQISRQFASPDPGAVVRDFFVDEDSLAFETHTTREIPPLAGAHGPVVIARCFAGEDGRVIGWLERYPPAVKAEVEAAITSPQPDPWVLVKAASQREVRRPTPGSTWVAMGSPEGRAICVPPKRADGSSASPVMPTE